MAIDYYQGADGGWANANFVSGAVPIDDDEIVIPSSIAVNISGTDQGGVDLDLLQIAAGFRGNIGASGDPLLIDGDKIVHLGSGTLFLKATDNEATDWVVVDSDNTSLAAHLDSEPADVGSGGTMTRVTVKKGAVTLAATLGIGGLPANLDIGFRNNVATDANVTLNCDLLATTGTLLMNGGMLTSIGNVPIAVQRAGTWVQDAGVITALHLMGGTCFLKTTETMALANVMGGILNLVANELGKTVTNIYLFTGGTLIYDPVLFTGTVHYLGGTEIKTTSAAEGGSGGAM